MAFLVHGCIYLHFKYAFTCVLLVIDFVYHMLEFDYIDLYTALTTAIITKQRPKECRVVYHGFNRFSSVSSYLPIAVGITSDMS